VVTYPLSFMSSGAKIRSRKYASSGCPLVASTRRPTQSVLTPYSHLSPGSKASGVRIDATFPVARAGIPVALT